MSKDKYAQKYEDINSWRDLIMEDTKLSYRAKLIAFSLSQYFRPERTTYPSIRTLSKNTSLTINPVQSAIKELINKEYIIRQQKRLKGNRFISNIYTFLVNDVSRTDTSNNDISNLENLSLKDLRKILYSKGRKLLDNHCKDSGALIGKWLSIYKHPIPVVLSCILDAEAKVVENPVSWIEVRLKPKPAVNNKNDKDSGKDDRKIINMDVVEQLTRNL